MWQSITYKVNRVVMWGLIALCLLEAGWIMTLIWKANYYGSRMEYYQEQYELCAGVKKAVDSAKSEGE
ncbi:MAG: hypothetical protein PHW53_04760 [Patescibacteria group bacterium]|nr:hypothetical protein [Patescibacteria group bacterium]